MKWNGADRDGAPEGHPVHTAECVARRGFLSYLRLETFHQDGHQEVEEDVIAKGHQGHKVEGCPGRGGGHPVIKHNVPVFLGEDLGRKEERKVSSLHLPRSPNG